LKEFKYEVDRVGANRKTWWAQSLSLAGASSADGCLVERLPLCLQFQVPDR
jgi:hypothetical protein